MACERLPSADDGGESVLVAQSDGREVWVRVTSDIFSAPAQSYLLEIVERRGWSRR